MPFHISNPVQPVLWTIKATSGFLFARNSRRLSVSEGRFERIEKFSAGVVFESDKKYENKMNFSPLFFSLSCDSGLTGDKEKLKWIHQFSLFSAVFEWIFVESGRNSKRNMSQHFMHESDMAMCTIYLIFPTVEPIFPLSYDWKAGNKQENSISDSFYSSWLALKRIPTPMHMSTLPRVEREKFASKATKFRTKNQFNLKFPNFLSSLSAPLRSPQHTHTKWLNKENIKFWMKKFSSSSHFRLFQPQKIILTVRKKKKVFALCLKKSEFWCEDKTQLWLDVRKLSWWPALVASCPLTDLSSTTTTHTKHNNNWSFSLVLSVNFESI